MQSSTRRKFLQQTAGTAALAAFAGIVPRQASARIIGANDRIRFGIIGAGGRGQVDLKAAIACPNVEFVGVADAYNRRFDEVHQFAPGVRTHEDFRGLLDRKDVDAVIVATPLHLHAPHFLASLQAGKDLYSEKTMTWSIPEASACRDAAAKSDRVVQVGLQHESDGTHADAVRWMREGRLGKVTQVEAWMSRNTPHGHGQWIRPVFPDCTPQNVRWNEFLLNRPKAAFDANRYVNWRLFWEYSGGNITENMIHQITWLITVLNLDIPQAAYMAGGVYGEKDGREVPDTIAVTLEYPELQVLWQSTFENSQFGLGERITGTDGSIEHVAGSTDMVAGKSAETIRYSPEKIKLPSAIGMQGTTQNVDHMQNFFDCVRSRKQPNAPVSLGYKSAVACHMANLAFQQKRRVTAEEAMNMTLQYTT